MISCSQSQSRAIGHLTVIQLDPYSSLFNPFLLCILHQVWFSPSSFDSVFSCLRDRLCCHWTEKEKTEYAARQKRTVRDMESGLLHPLLAEEVGQGRISLPDLQPPPYFLPLRERNYLWWLCFRQSRQLGQSGCFLQSATQSNSLFLMGLEHPTPSLLPAPHVPPPALLPSHHCDLLSYSVHLQFCCFSSYRRGKELAIYRPHLLSSPLLQQQKQLLPRCPIIYNLPLAWLASILPIWCFSWVPTPSLPA